MPQLLLELFSEEIPARMQGQAARDLTRLLTEKLTEAGFAPETVRGLAGPRRLTAVVDGLANKSADVKEERKGPRTDAPEKAIQGFLRGAGLESLAACETREDKKGAYYVAVIDKPGRAAADVIAEAVPDIVRKFPWPKSQKWGAGTLRWVRPLHRIVCVFDGEVVPFEIEGITSGDETEGHRLHGRGPFTVSNFADYAAALEGDGGIVLDAEDRKAMILAAAKKLCAAAKLELVEDAGLLDEVAGLAEHPVVLVGDMDPAFLDLPPEVIRLSMRTHQKYFAVRDPKTGDLAPKFVVVANQTAPDGGKAIAAGNARVLSARLNDARFFWDQDRKTKLEDMAAGLKDIVFHAKLGTMADKVERVAALARELAPVVGADPDLAEKAARLAKADLTSGMVGEFPELQGVMGRYYALLEAGLDPLNPSVILSASEGSRGGKAPTSGRDPSPAAQDDAIQNADAIRDHYLPQGPSDAVPREPVNVAVALADKLDTLVGFWAIDEKPTGSKDPYALRRAALGVVRIVLRSQLTLKLRSALLAAAQRCLIEAALIDQQVANRIAELLLPEFKEDRENFEMRWDDFYRDKAAEIGARDLTTDLLAFFADRLKVHLRDEGHRHDLVDAVFALGEDDLVLIVKRVEALGRFLDTEAGADLLAAYKRATNILRIEEKKDGAAYAGAPDTKLFEQKEEKELAAAIDAARATVDAALKQEDFAAAMAALAPLRPRVNAFFDTVTVNADRDELRRNRLLILAQIRDALSAVADLGKVEG